MDQMKEQHYPRGILPFNGPVEIGLRAVALLSEVFPVGYSFERLIICDYLIVHSDDVSDGPPGLHPKTPHRGGEFLVRRAALEKGIMLYQSRGLLERHFTQEGVMFAATEKTAAFLDVLSSDYTERLRRRACWVAERFENVPDEKLLDLSRSNIAQWGAEFTTESVLIAEDEEWN